MRRLALLLAVATAAVLAGCGWTGTGDPAGTEASLTLPPTTIIRTGGVAGVDETLRIDPNGQWAYTNKRANAESSGTLSDAQRRTVARLAGSPELAREAQGPTPTVGCADAFNYDVTVGATKISYVDCGTQSASTVKALLTAIVDATPL
jgi:hypothetical protein